MNDETPTNPAVPDEDLNTTPPQGIQVEDEKKAQAWKMPEPVFQQTSGYLPEGFEKRYGADSDDPLLTELEPTEAEPNKAEEVPSDVGPETADAPVEPQVTDLKESVDEDVPPTPVVVPANVDVEPQPDLIAELEAEPEPQPVTAITPKKKSAVGRIIGIFLALVLVIVLAIIFGLVILYILTPTPEATIN